MLDDMDAGQIAEWRAFFRIEEEEYKREELKARAEAAVQNYRRGRR
jgi:hypothetical protein